MKFLLSALAASVMLTAISCHQKSENPSQTQASPMQEMIIADHEDEAPPQNDQLKKEDQQSGNGKRQTDNSANADWDKKIIKTATLNVEVEDFKKFNAQIHELSTKWEGYIAREEENDSENKIKNSMTIKVPVLRFDEAINSISSLKGKMIVKQITSDDVTTEVLDIRTRAEAKKRIKLRYLDMLQKAKNMEEILQVEREINQIQEQIEAAEGRLNYLTHSTSFSTIDLSFYQVLDPKAIDDENPGYARRFIMALNEGLKWVGNTVIFFATLWPLWIFIVIIILIIKRVRFITIKVKE